MLEMLEEQSRNFIIIIIKLGTRLLLEWKGLVFSVAT